MHKLFFTMPLLVGWLTATAQYSSYPAVTLPQPSIVPPGSSFAPSFTPAAAAPRTYRPDEYQRHIQEQNARLTDGDIAEHEARQRRQQDEIDAIARRFDAEQQARERFFKENRARYWHTLAQLRAMLEGRAPQSVQQAVYLVENAYLNGAIPYHEFSAEITRLADACRALVREAGGSPDDPTAAFWALHRVMTDTIAVRLQNGELFRHVPFRYDFEDFWSEKDATKSFVSKLLRTNTGQCHSMPLLYRMVADQLGVKAYISVGPDHSFIQVKGADGAMYNYETTNGHFVTEGWILSNRPISPAALKNRMYLDTLTTPEVIARCVAELAGGFNRRYRDVDFLDACAALAVRHYPHGLATLQVVNDAAVLCMIEALLAAGDPKPADLHRFPEAQRRRDVAVACWRRIEAAGYEEMPKEMYAAWLNSIEEEKHRLESLRLQHQFRSPTPATR